MDVPFQIGEGSATNNPPLSSGCTTFETVKPVTLSPAAGEFEGPVAVTASSETANAEIRCTTNGNDPTNQSPLYNEPVDVSETTVIKCKAFKLCSAPSDIGAGLYMVQGPPPHDFQHISVDIAMAVDNVEYFRIHNGVLEWVHGSGARPSDPVVKIRKTDGSIKVVDPWVLSVSSTLDLGIDSQSLPGSGNSGFIDKNSIVVGTGRGWVIATSPLEIMIQDYQRDWSGYWFTFNYWMAP